LANLATVLKEEISRLARKEARNQTQKLHKAAAQYRRDIAALKRHVAAVSKELANISRQARKSVHDAVVAPAAAEKIRFSAKGLKSHRGLLGISAAEYGKLVGVTGHTIYKWEQGDTRPRQAQLVALAPVRQLRKTEASARLEKLNSNAKRSRKVGR